MIQLKIETFQAKALCQTKCHFARNVKRRSPYIGSTQPTVHLLYFDLYFNTGRYAAQRRSLQTVQQLYFRVVTARDRKLMRGIRKLPKML